MLGRIRATEGSLDAFSRGYEKFGFHIVPEGILYQEWAPGAATAALFGDFSKQAGRQAMI